MNNNEFGKKPVKYISFAEMNVILNYIKLNKSVYLRKKRDDEYFASSKCWIDVEPRNMTVLYKDDTGKARHYAFDLAEGNTHNKINPGVAIATLGKYYKIPEIKELYPERTFLNFNFLGESGEPFAHAFGITTEPTPT